MEKNEEALALTQMRRSVQELGSSAEEYGDPTLMRFLVANSMDASKAGKGFVQWHKWRAALVPSGFVPESEVRDELAARKIYLQGLNREGCPVVIGKLSKHLPSKDQLQFKKFLAHCLDKAIASASIGQEIGKEKLICILDLHQIAYKNVDARGLITGFQYLQSYYPERLARCYLLHMPRFFVSVWKIVSRFLEKATLEKIVIVSNEEQMEDMVEVIGEEVLPVEYGGRAKLIAIQDAVTPVAYSTA